MKKGILTAIAAAAFLCGTASADVIVNIGVVDLQPVTSVTVTVNIDPGLAVNGFSFYGNCVALGAGAWASDTQLNITGPSGSTVGIGGYPGGLEDLDWDFQGSGSGSPGIYTSGPHFTVAAGGPVFNSNGDGTTNLGGMWTFVFTQDWATSYWDDVSITLHQIPAPGALALIGLAGLAGVRRRR